MLRRMLFISMIFVGLFVVSCQQSAAVEEGAAADVTVIEVTREVEVIREVEVPVEVTRIVEIEADVASEQVDPTGILSDQLLPIDIESFESSITERAHRITIGLPMSYALDDGRDYPVAFVTDGDFYAIPLTMSAGQLAMDGEIPEVIVVGADFGATEIEDWVGFRYEYMRMEGREVYLQFFVEELIPYIESKYRVKSTGRTLVGHSIGGKFAIHAMLNAPGTFTNFIVSSPSDAFSFRSDAKTFAANSLDTECKLFISLAEEDELALISGAEKFVSALDSADSELISYELVTLDNETHLSVRPRAFNDGLRWIYAQ